MRFSMIASGSDGNAAVVDTGETVFLIDCGVSYRRLKHGLTGLGLSPEDIEAVLITHEHGDHVRGLGHLLAQHRPTVLSSAQGIGRIRRLVGDRADRIEWWAVDPSTPTWLGDVEVTALSTSHDARRPLGFRLQAASGRCLAYATDSGEVTRDLLEGLTDCDLVALEANHCPEMLRNGPYPRRLKRRIHSPQGHLSNRDAADLLARTISPRLQHVIALHLSRTNNLPGLAAAALSEAVAEAGSTAAVTTADRRGCGWIRL